MNTIQLNNFIESCKKYSLPSLYSDDFHILSIYNLYNCTESNILWAQTSLDEPEEKIKQSKR